MNDLEVNFIAEFKTRRFCKHWGLLPAQSINFTTAKRVRVMTPKTIKEILHDLLQCNTLTFDEANDLMTRVAKGELNDAQIASFLTIYMMRSVTVDELLGFRSAILNLSVKMNFDEFETMDVCGTGGDAKNTFNISTLTAFVLAGAGIKVAKHGNYGVSSVSGSSNMLEYFGYKFSTSELKLKRELEKTGICFLHAPLFHPALKTVAPVRKQLGVRTFFNMLGPLVNPSNPPVQVTGVFNLELQRIYHFIFQQHKSRYCVIHNIDGYDEISLTAPAKIFSNTGEMVVSPEDLGFKTLMPSDLYGGDTVEEAAEIFKNVLHVAATQPQLDAVVANTSIAIRCYYPEKSLGECHSLANESIVSGSAKKAFEQLMRMQ